MVGIVWATLSLTLGFGVYFFVPFVTISRSIRTRQKIGTFYMKMAVRCLKQFTFVRRVLSGYDILPITVDNEQKLLEVTLDSSTLGSDDTYQFKDPDNRIKRLWNKPVAIAYEQVPAAVDAELAELGHWAAEKHREEGIWHGELDDPDSIRVDPYIPVSDKLRLVDPMDTFNLVLNSIDPENIKTIEAITQHRYAKYGRNIGLAEITGTLMGFGVGMLGIGVAQYINQKLLRGAGGGIGNPVDSIGLGTVIDLHWLMELAVMAV